MTYVFTEGQRARELGTLLLEGQAEEVGQGREMGKRKVGMRAEAGP